MTKPGPKVLAAAWLLALGQPGAAQECRLALVLAQDVSGSVDAREDRLQREGLARALVSPEVTQAFLAGEPVALYAFEWAGEGSQAALLPGWQMIRNEQDLARVADVIAQTKRTRFFTEQDGTAMGDALAHAADVLVEAPPCDAQTIDVAGDGANNDSFGPQIAYTNPLLEGVTVNALVIAESEPDSHAPISRQELVAWFEDQVLHGPAAFWVLADGYDDYERAIAAKLRREVEMPLMSGWPTSPGAG